MTTKIQISVITLLSCFLSSCFTEKATEYTHELNYQNFLKDSLILHLDSVSNFEFYYTQSIELESEMLINLNKVNNSLDFYSMNDGRLKNRILLGFPDKFGALIPQGFFYHNSDSIFLFPQYQLNGTLILDNEGNVIEKLKIDFPEENDHPLVFNHVSSPSSPSTYINGKIIGSLANLVNTSSGDGIEKNMKKVFVLNLADRKFSFPDGLGYPSEYWGKAVTNHHSFLCTVWLSDKIFVEAYPLSDSVLLFDKELNFIGRRYFGSNFFDNFLEVQKGTSHLDHFKYVVSGTSYGRIIYDPYRNLVYRFVLIGRTIDTDEVGDYRSHHRNEIALIVADTAFRIKNEIKFAGSTYYPYSALLGKKGLYIPKINSEYKFLSEDRIVYDIFDFSNE